MRPWYTIILVLSYYYHSIIIINLHLTRYEFLMYLTCQVNENKWSLLPNLFHLLKPFIAKLTVDWLVEITKFGVMHPTTQKRMTKLIVSAFSLLTIRNVFSSTETTEREKQALHANCSDLLYQGQLLYHCIIVYKAMMICSCQSSGPVSQRKHFQDRRRNQLAKITVAKN